MPKPLVNNRIDHQNIYGLVSKHDLWLNQGVKTTDSPTFANLMISGDNTIQGNLYVEGNTTILNTNVIEFEDNIILLNRLETGNGVTLNQSGMEIDRGTLENYRMVYNESDKMFKVGLISNLQAVANREDYPLQGGIMMWNDTTKRIEARGTISIDLIQTSSKNSTSSSTGSIVVNGGIGIEKDMWIDGSIYIRGSEYSKNTTVYTDVITNNFTINSPNDIKLVPSGNVTVPFNSLIALGDTTGSISANNINKNVIVTSGGDVNFFLNANKKISVPNQIPIIFATQNERILTDNLNNMVIGSGQDILLEPGLSRKVGIPVDIPLVFSNNNQKIVANVQNDLSIYSGNNININPGQNLNVCIPTDNGIKFGNSGLQRIVSNSNNDLYIESDNSIYFKPDTDINITRNIPLTFGGTKQYIQESNGNLIIAADNNIKIIQTDLFLNSTSESYSSSNGSIYTMGGIGVEKTVYTKTGIIVDTQIEHKSLHVLKSSDSIFNVDTTNNSNVAISAGDSTQPSLSIQNKSSTNYESLIEFKTINDGNSGYKMGRGKSTKNSGRELSINIPSYSTYNNSGDKPKFVVTTDNCDTQLFSIETDTGNIISKGTFGLQSTVEANSVTEASFIVYGGLGIVKNIVMNGTMLTSVNSESALRITDLSENVALNVDTNTFTTTIDGTLVVNNSNDFQVNGNLFSTGINSRFNNLNDATTISNASVIVSGGVAIQKKLKVAGETTIYNTLDLQDNFITNVKTPVRSKDAATKEYVDLAALRGLYIKNSVQVATITAGNLNSDFTIGTVIDGYTLKIGDRVLIKNQNNPVENGMYIVNITGIPSRSSDLIVGDHAAGVYVFIQFGDLQGSTGWVCQTPPNVDLCGTDPLYFVQFSGLGEVTAGDGLSKDFNRIDVNVDNSSIEIASDILRVKSSIAGTGITGGSGLPLSTKSDQSHVTKLGTIDTGVWRASTVEIAYGGTGSTFFTSGNLVYGNNSDGLKVDQMLYYDDSQKFLAIGTETPLQNLHVASTSDVDILLDADVNSVSPDARPQIEMAYSGLTSAFIGMSRKMDDFSNNIYPDTLVISADKNDNTSKIQLATMRQSRITILSNGNVGINTSTPSVSLEVAGTMMTDGFVRFNSSVDSTDTSSGSLICNGGVAIQKKLNVGDQTHFYNENPSTSVEDGSVIVHGGLSIKGGQNAQAFGNGGGLTVAGGASIGGDIYIGGSINASGSSSSTFAYLTLTSTDAAENFSSGSLVCFGGVTIQNDKNSSSVTAGGSLLAAGGASIGKDLYVGGNTTLYGGTNYYSSQTNIISFYDESTFNLRYTIDRDIYNNDFSLSRYDNTSNFLEKVFNVNGNNGTILFGNYTSSLSSSTASVILNGGISINCSTVATNLSNGGCITAAGGLSVAKNVLIGKNAKIFSSDSSISTTTGALIISGGVGVGENMNIAGSFGYLGNAKFDIINNTSGSTLWTYIGQINSNNSAKCKIQFTNNNYTIEFISDVTNNRHITYGDNSGLILTVFKDNVSNKYHLFSQTPQNSTTFVHILYKTDSACLLANEGIGGVPSGIKSGFVNTWSSVYTSLSESILPISVGNAIIGDLDSSDTFPIFGRNNSNTVSSRDLGVAFMRYQSSNDTGTGEIVTDGYVFFDSIPNQVTASSTQIKLSNLTSSVDNYYNGWWIKVASGSNTNQVRQIVAYNGAQRVATIDVPWTNNNPKTGDIINFYNSQYVSLYFDDNDKKFNLVYNTRDKVTKSITSYDHVDLGVCNLSLSSTNASTNASNGSIYTLGGISINNTNDSVNISNGGTLTTLGGGAFGKTLYVGNAIGVGNSNFSVQESLHIKQQKSTLRLENDYNSVSYIDFIKGGTGNRFGILSDSINDQFCLTFTELDITPENSRKIFTITSDGYIGINTSSNINSAFTLKSGNLISCNDNSLYTGIISSSSNDTNNTESSKIVVYGNNAIGSRGNVIISSSTSGSIIFNTNNDTTRMNIDNGGTISFLSTKVSSNCSTGALCVSGGVSISCTQNSNSTTNGGSITINGGASVGKDFYVGGNVYVDGTINVKTSVLYPTLTFSNASNCSFGSYNNCSVLPVVHEAVLSFSFTVIPLSSSQNCYIEFSVPYKTTNFDNRIQLMASVSGYTDDTNVIPIFNTCCFGVKDSTNAFVSFQSVSTSIHYFTIIARYTMN